MESFTFVFINNYFKNNFKDVLLSVCSVIITGIFVTLIKEFFE